MKNVIILMLTGLVFTFCAPESLSQELKAGLKAPDFSLKDAFGNEYTLSSYLGKSPVVVYFYPAAGTAGCTKQACAIRDDRNKFEENNIKVFGISTDETDAIKKFVEDYNLNFPLLSDADKKVTGQYGVLNENGYARRVTFIISKEGTISEVFEVKDIESHSDYVFDAAMKLAAAEKN